MGLFSKIGAALSGKPSGTPAAKPIPETPVPFGSSAPAKIKNPPIGGVAPEMAKIPPKKDGGGSGSGSGAQTPAAPPYNPPDTDIVSWGGNGGISFFVKPKKIQGISELSISAAANLEEKEEGDEKFARRKTNGAIQIATKAYLNAFLGANVQETVNKAIEAARKGSSGYFYSYGKKLFTNQFMMTEAKASNILLSGTGAWVSCELDMTLKQSSKCEGSQPPSGGSGSGGSGSGGSSGGRYYKVQIAGMSELKIWSTSVQGAVTKAVGKKYTGYITVDGKNYHVTNGVIDESKTPKKKDSLGAAKEATKPTDDAKKQSQAVLQASKRNPPESGTPPQLQFGTGAAFD